jgi:guanine deaminase
MIKNDRYFLKLAVNQAKKSVKLGGFPAGAILVKDGKIMARASALGNKINDPTSHPEISAIRLACKKLKTTDLSGAIIYASMESCLMCFMADAWANISKIVYACRRSLVSSAYYGNSIDLRLINQQNLHQITLEFIPDFESEVLKLIKDWEKKIVL